MARYAYFDSTAAAPAPVLGWYDTAAFNYAALPASADLLAITDVQWDARLSGLWAVSGGALVAYTPPAPVLTLAQQAAAAMLAGLAITSAGTPALDATYAVDDTAQGHIQAEMIALLYSGGATFTDGTGSIVWPDMAGTNHTFTAAAFKPFALAAGAYVAALFKVINGTLGALPAATATIP